MSQKAFKKLAEKSMMAGALTYMHDTSTPMKAGPKGLSPRENITNCWPAEGGEDVTVCLKCCVYVRDARSISTEIALASCAESPVRFSNVEYTRHGRHAISPVSLVAERA
jgi:hypothetical protein